MIWQIIGASTTGTSHVRTDLPCQDAHNYRYLENLVIAAVADGLGSAAKSDEAARLAVETALSDIEKAINPSSTYNSDNWTQILRDAFVRAREHLQEAAEKIATPIREYGTTLIVMILTKDCLAVGHIGDGAVVALFADGAMETISAPHRGEYANEVVPLTDAEALSHVRFGATRRSVKAVALLTDGLQNLCINAASSLPYEPFFNPFFDAVCEKIDTQDVSRQLADFLDSATVCSKTDDDKTLLIVGTLDKNGTDLSERMNTENGHSCP